ncbi:MAG: outer membrane beta-barrel protein [Bacteroidales bacterium]|nr:outer membrane beta-barrel protein [Bacteroidales bacterium]
MLKRLLLPVIVLSLGLSSYSQPWKLLRYEGALGIGTTNVYGDLGGAPNASSLLFIRDFTFRNTRPSIYAALRYKIDPKMALKLNLIYGFSRHEDYTGSRLEEREFVSVVNLFEVSGQYEFYFLQEERKMRSAAMFNRRGMVNNYSAIGAYVFAGVGATIAWADLELEPRSSDVYKPETKVIASFPIGLGIKYVISDHWMLGWELGYRHTLSDYLDGIKTPWSNNSDVYWISSLNLSYRIPTSRRGIPTFLDRQWRRARF